jgi:microcystin-dependent protein
LTLLLAVMSPCAHAQLRTELTYKARITGTLGTAQEKWILEAVLAQAPGSIVSIDLALAQAKLRTAWPLHPGELNAMLQPHGVQLELTSVSNQEGTELRMAEMPAFIHTGNAVADQAAYENALQAWMKGLLKERPQSTNAQ